MHPSPPQAGTHPITPLAGQGVLLASVFVSFLYIFPIPREANAHPMPPSSQDLPHAPQVVRHDVGPHLEVVDHHGGHGGRGAEDAAGGDDDVNVVGLEASLVQQVLVGWCVELWG